MDKLLKTTSLQADYTYALGDATTLYNTTREGATAVTLAERAILWLKPVHIIVYDRKMNYFKRLWLQLPTEATVNGQQALMTTTKGQQLFVTTLLPTDGVLTAVNSNEQLIEDTAASNDPMKVRLRVDAAGLRHDVP